MYYYRPHNIELHIYDTDIVKSKSWVRLTGFAFSLFGKSKNQIEVMVRRGYNGLLQLTLDTTVGGLKRRGIGEIPGQENERNFMCEVPPGKSCTLYIHYDWIGGSKNYQANFYIHTPTYL